MSSALVALRSSWRNDDDNDYDDAALLDTEDARGLLFGMTDLSKEHFFVGSSSSSPSSSSSSSTNNHNSRRRMMDLSLDHLEWLNEPDLFWSAALQDAEELGFSCAEEYLTTVSQSLQLYLDSSGSSSTVRLEEDDEEEEEQQEQPQQEQDLPLHEQYLDQVVSQEAQAQQEAQRGGGVGRGQLTFLLGASHGKSRALHNQFGQPWIQAIARGTVAECTHFPVFVATTTTTKNKNKKNQLAQAIGWATHDIQFVFGKQEILSLATTWYEKALVQDVFDGFEQENDELMISSLEELSCWGGGGTTDEEEEEGPISSACFEKLVLVLRGLQRERQRLEEQNEDGDGSIQTELARLMGIGARRKKSIYLILDNAEQWMNPKDDDDDAETRNALQALLYWCSKGLHIFLVSSDLNYRWDLLGRKQHVALSHPSMVTNVIIAADRSPCQLWNLMVHAKYNNNNRNIRTTNHQGSWRTTTTLGFGPRLAKLFLAAYAGHLQTFERVLSDLYVEQYDFVASSTLPVHVSDSVKDCLQVLGTRELLTDLARHGFVPLFMSHPFSNEAVARICKSGVVGGVVCHGDRITGLPMTVWSSENHNSNSDNNGGGDGVEGCKYCLIPILQSTRIVIADLLLMNPPVADKMVVYRYEPPAPPRQQQQTRTNNIAEAQQQRQQQQQLVPEAQPDQLQPVQVDQWWRLDRSNNV